MSYMKKTILPLIGMLLLSEAQSQSFYGTAFAGGANYQGELQELSFAFPSIRFTAGIGGQLRLNDHLWVNSELMWAHLGGNDADIRINSSNVARNLSFETELQELSLRLRLNILPGIKQPFVPYVTAGAAVFRIDPYAFDGDGVKHFLYPLSTEGQGLPDYPDRKVPRRVNLSLPMGGGLEFKLSRTLRVDLEMLYRKTFTDHIDDVSSFYPDADLLLAARGAKAVEMSYRGREIPGGRSSFPSGAQRGNPNRMDWYHTFNIRLKYAFSDPSQSRVDKRKISSIDCWRGGGR
jgi:opacity protein-like surface antigen